MRLIDADALMNKMQKDPLFDLVERYGVSGVINAEPTVDAVPVRHGKWINREYGLKRDGRHYPFWERYECSVCGAKADESDYCPNCGARMDEEKR